MEGQRKLTHRERLWRIAGGLGVTVVGCVIFALSKAHDPHNRAAILAIFAILAGLSWFGQGLRGRRDGPIYRDEPSEPLPTVSPERTVAGILAAWLVPGLGHWLIGRRGKAVLFFLTVTITFVAGVALAEGRNLHFDRDRVWFLAYMFNGVETGLGWLLTRGLELDRPIRFYHVGFLYSAVACLLNLVAMMDFIATCTRGTEEEAIEALEEAR